MIVIDTSALIDSLAGARRSGPRLYSVIRDGTRVLVPSLVLYEWLRGPRSAEEIAVQENLFPAETAQPFTTRDAILSAELYRKMRRPRGREIDLAIAACALNRGAELWTLNKADFADIPGLRLLAP